MKRVRLKTVIPDVLTLLVICFCLFLPSFIFHVEDIYIIEKRAERINNMTEGLEIQDSSQFIGQKLMMVNNSSDSYYAIETEIIGNGSEFTKSSKEAIQTAAAEIENLLAPMSMFYSNYLENYCEDCSSMVFVPTSGEGDVLPVWYVSFVIEESGIGIELGLDDESGRILCIRVDGIWYGQVEMSMQAWRQFKGTDWPGEEEYFLDVSAALAELFAEYLRVSVTDIESDGGNSAILQFTEDGKYYRIPIRFEENSFVINQWSG